MTSANPHGEALVVGAVLVLIILFLFLMNVRTTFISLTAIPLSLIHSVMQSRTAAVVDGIEMAGIRLLNLLNYQRSRADNSRA